MRRRSHSKSRTDYISYEFTASAGFDYNYDPSRSRTPEPKPDPYSDDYSSSPVTSGNHGSSESHHILRHRQAGEASGTTTGEPLAPSLPSSEYILESRKPSKHIEDPSRSRKLLILDLNGTLVLRSPHVRREYRPRQRRHHKNTDQAHHQPPHPEFEDPYADPSALRPLRTVHGRPYLASFREYIFHPHTRKWLDTMVWSSAQPHSVADMVEKCFGDRKDELVVIWARDTLGLEEKDYHRKTQTTKDLAKPWAALPISPTSDPSAAAETPQEHSAHTTLLLDDSPRKAHLQPWNHLCIREYVQELRNADIACRMAERNRENAEAASLDEEQASPDGKVDAAGPAEAVNTQEAKPNTGESEITNKKKRKRPKKKKKAEQVSAVDSDTPAVTYDQTLLAVIGVLDRIKHQSNVAGWMHSGGLRFGSEETEETNAAMSDASTPSTQTENGMTELKRRRVSGEQPSEEPWNGIDPSSSPPGLNAAVALASGQLIVENEALDTRANIGDSGQWYEDVSIMHYWVARGVRALENLGIEVIPGIVV
ncbi:hypothetical protein Hypma_010484 [Hypsizygus marmoreus]|uniref:Mitochondrial import inner membrane translocase subunit TIM50 n=1 Tax=Hypsizygus marmoreus TaxID=39966 RepID=A0A369JJJ1_HYPMA|nr:hypothetical protein Hypma_010484 [Hypsizygus marmoreus]